MPVAMAVTGRLRGVPRPMSSASTPSSSKMPMKNARSATARGDRRFDLAARGGHRTAVGHKRDIALAAGQLGDDVGDAIQDSGAQQHAAQLERPQAGLAGAGELRAQLFCQVGDGLGW
jgi:hypothetical protein